MTAAIADAPTPSTVAGAESLFSGMLRTAPQERRPHLAPVPDSAPPFDDELVGGATPVIGTEHRTGAALPSAPIVAARNLVTRTTLGGADPVPSAVTRTAPTTITVAGVPCWSKEADIGVVRTTTAELPVAQRAASVLARAVIEVLSGHRPVAQLRVHCAPAVYAGLCARTVVASRPLPHLLSVRVCEPTDGIAEASAVFRRADRVRALAFRLQGVDGRWRITALQVG